MIRIMTKHNTKNVSGNIKENCQPKYFSYRSSKICPEVDGREILGN
jgi:hypothetical protein